ncbi:hypothetical protein BCR39DRAFT_561484 [Naematelia encephala]|uniref:F-box domain-containing protein n=1 Tax=Naematelia encephala TaxID=71784 RepID=A0A1Y2ARJ3_9TREE|nr:hypothetical protein BCR39DRAFT_561484 [Naematelia encephala]
MNDADPLSPVKDGRAVTWKPSSVLDVSVRGKGNKDKAGWGALPPTILHRILHHSIDDIELDGARPRLVPHPGRSRSILRAVLSRIWLCRLRLVSSPWRDSVDSFSFWNECIHHLSPHYNPHLYHDSPRLTSSTKPPSAFSRARAAITPVCLVCRVNRPMYRPSASDKRCLTPTPKYGYILSCLGHFDRFCFGCLTAAPDNQTADDTFPAAVSDPDDDKNLLALSKSISGDVDENGHERYRPIRQCADCRKVIIDRQIEQLLVQCSRGGPVRGLAGHCAQTTPYTDYVMWSEQTAYHAAQMAVDEYWLLGQTRWDELMLSALDLENHYLALKMQYKVQGLYEKPEQKRKRHAILRELWGGAKGHDYRDDEAYLGRKYKGWNLEVLHNLFEEEFESCDRLPLDGRSQLKIASIQDWITTRISYGLWVAPSEEVRLLSADPIGHFKHFRSLALSAVHPAHTNSDDNPSSAVDEFNGLIDLRLTPGGAPFLPTPRLLEDLDHDYRECLKTTVIDAMEELVNGVLKQCGGDSDSADRICERMGVQEILAALTNKLIWTNRGYTMAVEATLPQKVSSISAAGSPRIELIHEQVDEPQFLIEVDGEAVSEAPASTEELKAAIITMAQSTPPTEHSTKQVEQANESAHVSSSPKTKRKEPEDLNTDVDDERRKRPFPSSSSPDQSGLETDSAQSSDDVWSVPGPITPDDFVPYTSPLNADMVAMSQSTAGKNDASLAAETLASDSPLTTTSSLSIISSPARASESSPAVSTWDVVELESKSDPTKMNLHWHTLPHEIPWIPQASPDMLGNVTVQCIMAAWFQARAGLRECRCGICEREKRRGWGALFAR